MFNLENLIRRGRDARLLRERLVFIAGVWNCSVEEAAATLLDVAAEQCEDDLMGAEPEEDQTPAKDLRTG